VSDIEGDKVVFCKLIIKHLTLLYLFLLLKYMSLLLLWLHGALILGCYY